MGGILLTRTELLSFVDKILEGAPELAKLRVEQAGQVRARDQYENARALRLPIPQTLLLQADQGIE